MNSDHNYLIHYGILGQKWGKRNGPPYPLSSEQQSSSERKAKAGRWFNPTVKGGKDKPNISPAEKIAKESRNISDNTKDIVNRFESRKPNQSSETAQKMSDEELRKAINRIELERRYDSLTREDTRDGFEIAGLILDDIGSIAAIAASTFAIMSVIKGMK